MPNISVVGLAEWAVLFDKILDKLKDETFAREISELFARYAHVDTGFLRSSMYYSNGTAGSRAIYASVEVDRGGSHDFVTQALNAFDLEATVSEALYGLY